MGVNRHDYVIVGYKLPYDVSFKESETELNKLLYEEERYLPLIEGHKDEKFSIVMDGMGGNYIAFGKLIQSADEYEGFDFLEISVNDIDFQETITKAKELFKDLDFDFSNPKLLVFSNYY